MRFSVVGTLLCAIAISAANLSADEGGAAASQAPASLIVNPSNIHLSAVRDRQSVIVQAVMANGLTYDVTDQAEISIGDEAMVRRDGMTFHPVADGETTVQVSYG